MSSKFKAIDDIKKLSKFISGLVEFGEELEKIGSLENASAEAVNRLNKAASDEKVIQAKIASLSEDLAKVKLQHDAEVAKQAEILKAQESQALDKAAKILEAAKAKAEELLGDAEKKKIKIAFDVQELASAKAGLDSEVSQLQEKVAGLKNVIAKIAGTV